MRVAHLSQLSLEELDAARQGPMGTTACCLLTTVHLREREMLTRTYRPILSFIFGGRTHATQKRMHVEQGPTSPSQRIFLRLHLSQAFDKDLPRGRHRWVDDGEGVSPMVARLSRGRAAMPSSAAVAEAALPGPSVVGVEELMGSRIAQLTLVSRMMINVAAGWREQVVSAWPAVL